MTVVEPGAARRAGRRRTGPHDVCDRRGPDRSTPRAVSDGTNQVGANATTAASVSHGNRLRSSRSQMRTPITNPGV